MFPLSLHVDEHDVNGGVGHALSVQLALPVKHT